MASKIEFKSIWEDSDLFEVRISASNDCFSGIADCYTIRSEIKKLGELLKGFPKSIDAKCSFSTFGSEDYSYFNLDFKCTDGSGHVKVRVKVVHSILYSNAKTEYYSSEFDIDVEPSKIDIFVPQLIKLAETGIGEVTAILEGKT